MLIKPNKIYNKKFNVANIRKDFPILKTKSNKKPLIFFDNGASSQKPKVVLEKIKEIMETCVELEVPSKVEYKIDQSWGHAK